jgi:outer membrane protein TolC
MNKTFIIIHIITWGLVSGMLAQSPEELYQMALNDNYELKAMHKEYQAALRKAPQLSQLPSPEMGMGGFILPVETRVGAQRARIGATQMFPWPGQLKLQTEQALTGAEVHAKRITAYQLDLRYQIDLAWLDLYQLQESRKIIQKHLGLVEALKKLSETKVAAGKATIADVLRVDLKIQEITQNLEILKVQQRSPLIVLNQLLNRPLETPIVVDTPLTFANLPEDKDSLFQQIWQNYPDLQMFTIQQSVARQSIEINRRAGRPSLGLGADYIAVSPRSDAAPVNNGRDILQIRGTLSIPIYRQKYTAKEEEEKLKIEAWENRKKARFELLKANVEKAYADFETASLKNNLYRDQIKTVQATIKILETDYSNQSKGFDELIRLETQLFDYDLELLRAIITSHKAKAGIKKYIISY